MQISMEPRVVSLDGPPYVFPKWSSKLRSKTQEPSSASSSSSASTNSDTNAAAMTMSKGRAEFESVVRPALPRLFRFCLSLTGRQDQADDLFQNALVKAYVNAASYEGRSDVGVWLCGIAWHEHLELRRTEARRKGLFTQFVDACSSALGFGADRADTTTPESLLAEGQNHDILLRCLQTLPEEFRAVVVLCDIEEIGYERASEILGIPKGTVKSRHARGRVRLREAYEKLGVKTINESKKEGKESTA
ncbi:MAG TPA: RNA polymerase sigma factor [Polyangium sp.]|nr:RNA polymerase sigma factor [Polyangium sp.]